MCLWWRDVAQRFCQNLQWMLKWWVLIVNWYPLSSQFSIITLLNWWYFLQLDIMILHEKMIWIVRGEGSFSLLSHSLLNIGTFPFMSLRLHCYLFLKRFSCSYKTAHLLDMWWVFNWKWYVFITMKFLNHKYMDANSEEI